MAVTKDEILDAISKMSVMEVVELIADMEKKFNVTAAAPVAAAAADAFTGSERVSMGDRLAARTARPPGLHSVQGSQREPENACHLNMLQGD